MMPIKLPMTIAAACMADVLMNVTLPTQGMPAMAIMQAFLICLSMDLETGQAAPLILEVLHST